MRYESGVGKSLGSLAVTGFSFGEASAIRLANWSLYWAQYDSRGMRAASGKSTLRLVEWKQLVTHLRTRVQRELMCVREAALGVKTALP